MSSSASLTWHAVVPNPLKHGRAFASIIAIACGVALGLAVYLVNRVAVDEFSSAIRQLSGTADLLVSGPRMGFSEDLYGAIATLPGVAAASPVLEIRATLAGRKDFLKILGVDPLRASEIHPDWFAKNADAVAKLLTPDTLLLSAPAARSLKLSSGGTLAVQVGLQIFDLKILTLLPDDVSNESFAIMDIANAQWRFEKLRFISRMELRVSPGADSNALRQRLSAILPAGVALENPEITAKNSAALSQAYRVNIMILALVALFTGVFLVFSTQALEVVKRRPQLALLRVLGLSRRQLVTSLLLEGAAIGACGALLGVLLGYGLAGLTLRTIGADLGAGYFVGVTPTLKIDWVTVIAFLIIGTFVAVLGTLLPALEAAATQPAPALRAGSQELPLRSWSQPGWGLAAWGLAVAALLANQATTIPYGGYVAILLLLGGTLMMLPALARHFFARLPNSERVESLLAREHLRNAYGHVAMSVAALFVSFCLIVAMGIMVYSFRASVSDWLDAFLPADLYVRSGQAGESSFLDEATQHAIAATPEIGSVGFVRFQSILLVPGQPAVALIARPVAEFIQHGALPLIGAQHQPRAGEPPPVWISEAIADLYGYRVGQQITIPIAGHSAPFLVAGIWRDYARQFGALLIERDDYVRLTGDRRVNDAAIFLAPNTSALAIANILRDRIPGGKQLDFITSAEVRKISLKIFDRSFYVTYALEMMTVLIGLFGVSASLSASLLMRRREFGLLRHIGLTRRQIVRAIGLEGAWIGVLGALSGGVVGFILSLILIRVVTRLSFHWSMDLHVPWFWLALLSLGLVAATTFTARLSANAAMRSNVEHAVREDW